ncbi:hypothetical protein EJ04DRAFT_539319 [Polyplosphaeria fusca]|uniref:Uncharacterized protein n=1 Tax=Polyplosphaeria fusca TaxID=682080 RepID=A0A9P4UVZ6_9PLEO|nr:hypothetical protein EJ04DRAFT_539319 [Polyplosphaeria fusca]
MPSSIKRTTTRALATSAVITNVHPSHRSNPSSATDSDSCWEGESSTESLSDTYADPDTETDEDIELGTREDAGLMLEKDPDPHLDSEAEEILKDIAQLKAEGQQSQTIPSIQRNYGRGKANSGTAHIRYCDIIKDEIKRSPEEQLRACEPEIFKAVKKESSMRSYWKRLSMCYMDLTRHKMDADVLTDWIPTLMLDKSEMEKHAMNVQGLYAILHALWVDDTKPLHGFIRVQISLLLLLSAATATKPGAVVESASAKGSNKALSSRNIEILKVRSIVDPRRSTIVANVNGENKKDKEKDGKP